MDNHRNKRGNVGRKGEDEAVAYLMDSGHTILERNWRWRHLEIDIITLDKDGLHFVEVKTRRPPFQAEPQDCVTYTKQKRITMAAKRYLALKGLENTECRFDILAIVLDKDGTHIRYIPEAFFPVYL